MPPDLRSLGHNKQKTYFLASANVGVEEILCTVDWLKIKNIPLVKLPKNKFQNVCRVRGSKSKLLHVKRPTIDIGIVYS